MKKGIIKTLFAGILTAGLSIGALAGCTDDGSAAIVNEANAGAENKVYRTLDEIKAAGSVNIGVFSDKNPFGYVDENGTYQGYDVYFA